MAEITAGTVRLYKTAGPSQQEKIIMAGPVPPEELHFRQNTSTGERFLLKNGFDMQEDEILQITFNGAVSVAASTKLKLTCLINYKGIDRPKTLDHMLLEADFTKTANTLNVETEIAKYQVPKGVSLAFRRGDQFYLYLDSA
jgi:hypothetical protein